MIERINLHDFEPLHNYLLIQTDPNYNFIEIPGPSGTKISLELVDTTSEWDTKNISMSGMVLKAPNQLFFDSELRAHEKGKSVSHDEYSARMRTSMPWDTVLSVQPGDRVIFDYKQNMEIETDGRLLKDENGEFCLLVRYDNLFAKEIKGEYIPINGWVFFVRDQREEHTERASGIVVVNKTDKYECVTAAVFSSDEPIKTYMDKAFQDPDIDLSTGQRIFVQRKFGFRLAYDTHAGKLKGVEAIKRKNILAIME